MKKFLFSAIATIACMAMALPAQAEVTGKCGDNATYTVSDNGKTITISGTGDMYDYDDRFNGSPWYGVYNSSLTTAIIEDGITHIGAYSFYFCERLSDITIPSSVTSIGNSGFFGVAANSINIPKTVTSIGKEAFSSCGGFTNFTIPNSVQTINSATFASCTKLSSIVIPHSVTSIGESAFSRDSELVSVTIGKSVNSIDNYAFSRCTSLTDIVCHVTTPIEIAENVFNLVDKTKCTLHVPTTSVDDYKAATVWQDFNVVGDIIQGQCGDNAFYTISDGGKTINIFGTGNMYDYTSYPPSPWVNDYNETLTTAIIEDGITHIGSWAFGMCSKISDITIPSSVTSIGNYAFHNCPEMTSITIPNSVQSIGEGAFAQCTKLSSIVIPHSVTSIGECAFINDSELVSVTIGKSVNSIDNYAFSLCTSLTEIRCHVATPIAIEENVFSNVDKTNCALIVTKASESLYKAAPVWQGFFNVITGVSAVGADSENALVDVYNMNGALLRHQVLRSNATDGLYPGFYIVGGKKVMVK